VSTAARHADKAPGAKRSQAGKPAIRPGRVRPGRARPGRARPGRARAVAVRARRRMGQRKRRRADRPSAVR